MTEEEKIFSGRVFNPAGDELRAIRRRAHDLCRRYNAMDDLDPERSAVMRDLLGGIGEKFSLQAPVQFNYGRHTFIGRNFVSNFNLVVLDDACIHIGDNVMCGPNVSLVASDHPLVASERVAAPDGKGGTFFSEFAREINIGNNVWIACGTIIFGGVTIGDNAVIGAGSVVTRDIPAGYLAYGVPCKPVRPITEKDSKIELF